MAVNTAMPGRGLGIPALQPDPTGGFDDIEGSRPRSPSAKNTAFGPRAQVPETSELADDTVGLERVDLRRG